MNNHHHDLFLAEKKKNIIVTVCEPQSTWSPSITEDYNSFLNSSTPLAHCPPPRCRCLCRDARASSRGRPRLRFLSSRRCPPRLAPTWALPLGRPAPWGFLPVVPRSRLAPTQPQHLSSFGAEEGPNSVVVAAAAERERKGNKHGLNMQKETFPIFVFMRYS